MELIYDIAVLIMFSIFYIYFFYVKNQFGILPSISDSYKRLEKQKRNKGWWFLVFAWGLAFPMVAFMCISPWFVISIFCALLLGAAPQQQKKLTGIVHVVGALGSLLSALIFIGIFFGNWWCLGIVLITVGLLRLLKTPNITTWEETVAFMGTCIGLWIR